MPTNVIMPAFELAQIHMTDTDMKLAEAEIGMRRNEFAPLRTRMGDPQRIRDVRAWSACPLSSCRNGALPRSVGQCRLLPHAPLHAPWTGCANVRC